MLSCKEVVKNISSDQDNTWRKKIEMRFHLFVCTHCSTYAKHLSLIKAGFKNLVQSNYKKIEAQEIKDLEEKIIATNKKSGSP